MRGESSTSCGRAIELRRFRAGELEGAERERISQHLTTCDSCRARIESFDRELDSIDVAVESAKILERLERAEPKAPWWRVALHRPAFALALLLLVAIPVAIFMTRPAPTTRIKGSVGLEMYVKDGAGSRLAAEGETLGEGDQIQFKYRAAGKRYLFVVSVSSNGAIDPLYPDDPSTSIEVTPSGTNILEGSVILDDARGQERVFALFSDRPLSFDELERAAKKQLDGAKDVTRLQELDLGREDVDEATVWFRKE